jgi:hypothetical protein
MAFPAIGRARELGRYPLGPYIGVLLGDVEAAGQIQYGHVLDVFDPRTGRRVFVVAAESNQLAGMKLGGGSHFICGYDGESHLNYGSSDDYAGRDRFLVKARELVFDHFRLPREPLEQAIVAEQARPHSLPAIPVEEGDERPVRHAGSPALGMWLTLAGVVTMAVPTMIFYLPHHVLEHVYHLMGPISDVGALLGRGLFILGCFLAASRLPSREGFWMWPAGIVAAVSAVLVALSIVLHLANPKATLLLVDRFSPRGVFMLALLLHGVSLLLLSYRFGLNFHPRLVFLVMGGWVVLTGVVFFTTWTEGFVPRWAPMGVVVGMAIWAVVQLIVTGKMVSNSGRQRLAE